MMDDLARLAADLGAAAVTVPLEVQHEVRDAAEATRTTAQRLVPVDTGELRDSITVEVDGLTATVSADADYAMFVEFGTSKMAPDPFLGPALEAEGDAFVEAVAQTVDDLL